MLKKLYYFYFLIFTVQPKRCLSECAFALRTKMILSLSQDLFVKNIILIKQSSLAIDAEAISLAKTFSESNIYHSFLSAKEMKMILNSSTDRKVIFSKTLVATFQEEHNHEIFELISENEGSAWKFLWVVWNNKNGSITENKDLYIPYNSQLLIVHDKLKNISYISEIYHPRIFSSITFKRHFGIWSENKGLEIPERDLYKRRLNMNGTYLNILIDPMQFPYIIWIDILDFICDAMNWWSNLIVLDELMEQKRLGQKTEQYEIDIRTGIYNSESVHQERVLGFAWKQSAYMYIRYDEILEEHDIVSYLRPFSLQLWWAILISIATIGMCTLIVVYKNKSDIGYLSACYHPLEAITNQDGSTTPKSTPIRITIITARLVAMILVPHYSGFLLNYILFPSIKLPFEDFKGLVEDGSYKIGYPTSSNFDAWFEGSNDFLIKTAYEKNLLKPDEMPKSEVDLMEKICRYQKVSFITFEDLTGITGLTKCKIIKIPKAFATGWHGLLLRENSPYKKIFNRLIKMLISAGTINKFDKTLIFWQAEENLESIIENGKNSVKIESVTPVFRIIFFVYGLAFLILLLECLYKKWYFPKFKKFLGNGIMESAVTLNLVLVTQRKTNRGVTIKPNIN